MVTIYSSYSSLNNEILDLTPFYTVYVDNSQCTYSVGSGTQINTYSVGNFLSTAYPINTCTSTTHRVSNLRVSNEYQGTFSFILSERYNLYYYPTHFSDNSSYSTIDSEEEKRKLNRRSRHEKNALYRGLTLLESIIPQIEYENFKKSKSLEVNTEDYLYKLQLGEKVKRLNKVTGKEDRLCIVTEREKLPAIDKLIGLKLLIESDEKYLTKIANVINW